MFTSTVAVRMMLCWCSAAMIFQRRFISLGFPCLKAACRVLPAVTRWFILSLRKLVLLNPIADVRSMWLLLPSMDMSYL